MVKTFHLTVQLRYFFVSQPADFREPLRFNPEVSFGKTADRFVPSL
jgi:hypothetical protein